MAARKTAEGRKCQVFYCDHRKGRWCCADCPDLCDRRCLNHPDRCKLVDLSQSVHIRRGPRSFDPEAARRLWGQGLTDAEIGERLGCSKSTIASWRRGIGLGVNEKKRRRAT